MNDSLYEQIKTLFLFNICGFSVGFLFDFFRVQRKIIKTNDFVTYMQDIIFWILSGIIIIFTVINFTDGEIRSYMILGGIVGTITYFLFISKYIMSLEIKIVRFFLKILAILCYPIKKIYEKMKKG